MKNYLRNIFSEKRCLMRTFEGPEYEEGKIARPNDTKKNSFNHKTNKNKLQKDRKKLKEEETKEREKEQNIYEQIEAESIRAKLLQKVEQILDKLFDVPKDPISHYCQRKEFRSSTIKIKNQAKKYLKGIDNVCDQDEQNAFIETFKDYFKTFREYMNYIVGMNKKHKLSLSVAEEAYNFTAKVPFGSGKLLLPVGTSSLVFKPNIDKISFNVDDNCSSKIDLRNMILYTLRPYNFPAWLDSGEEKGKNKFTNALLEKINKSHPLKSLTARHVLRILFVVQNILDQHARTQDDIISTERQKKIIKQVLKGLLL